MPIRAVPRRVRNLTTPIRSLLRDVPVFLRQARAAKPLAQAYVDGRANDKQRCDGSVCDCCSSHQSGSDGRWALKITNLMRITLEHGKRFVPDEGLIANEPRSPRRRTRTNPHAPSRRKRRLLRRGRSSFNASHPHRLRCCRQSGFTPAGAAFCASLRLLI